MFRFPVMNDRARDRAAWEGELFRLLVENVHDYAIFAIDEQRRVLSWTAAAERMLGYREEEIVGQSADCFFTPEDRAAGAPEREVAQVLAAGRSEDDRWHVRHDGSRFWSSAVMTALWSPEGALRGFAKILRDRSELKRTEVELRESEQRFTRFTQHLPGLAWIKDLQGRYVYANEAATRSFGRPASELYGKTDAEIFPHETAAQFSENDRRARESGAAVQGIETLRHPDGTVHHSLVSKFPIPAYSGEPALVGGMAIDVTDRIAAEQEVERLLVRQQKNALRLRRLAEAARNIHASVSLGDVLEMITEEARQLIGAEEAQSSLGEEEPPPGWLAAPLAGRDGRPIGHIRLSPKCEWGYNDDDRAILSQLAAIASAAIENSRLYDQLRDADRRKDEFLAMLAHELRNPLAPIRSGLDVLEMSGAQHDIIGLMKEQVVHLVRLVDDLLDVSRIMRGTVQIRREPIELSAVVQRSIEAIRPFLEDARHALQVHVSGEPLWVEADPVRLTQVFTNLLHNSVKYTEPGGRIAVSLSREFDQAVAAVRDTGIGIEPDLLPHVFDLFRQADQSLERSRGGLGIGLTLVRRLIELHGGAVEARSPGRGKGSEFFVRLPLAHAAARPVELPPPGGQTRGRRILVVDDNVGAAQMLGLLFQSLGPNDVESADDGLAALEAVAAFRPDIIVLDIGLPRMNGYEVARRIRAQPECDRVLLAALTGYGTEDDRRRSLEAGFDLHLVKPPALESLKQLFTHPKLMRP
jgi:PAS domain S-box-containing protein